MARNLPILAVTLDGRPTTAQLTGHGAPDAVVLTTALADTALALTSVYLGAGQGSALAAHLVRAPGHKPKLIAHDVDTAELPVTHARERCLLDHAAALQQAAEELGHTLAIELSDAALAAARGLYDPAP